MRKTARVCFPTRRQTRCNNNNNSNDEMILRRLLPVRVETEYADALRFSSQGMSDYKTKRCNFAEVDEVERRQ